jgi:hypothetical protein
LRQCCEESRPQGGQASDQASRRGARPAPAHSLGQLVAKTPHGEGQQDLESQASTTDASLTICPDDTVTLSQQDLTPALSLFGPRGIAHAYIVRSERARMLVTASPGGVEAVFVSLGVPVTGSEPPTDAVMPPMDELVRLFADYGCEILGPPLSLSDLS